VYSALLARKGFTGTENALEAAFGGFITTYSNKYNALESTANLGTQWETLNVAYKPYPTVASIHTALDGFRAIVSENKLNAEDIASVDVGIGHLTYQHCAWEYKPNGITAAQMNLFYPLALIAVDRDAGVNQFREDRLADPQLLALIGRMTAHVSDELEAMGREYRHASTMTVKTKDGRVLERTELHRRGTKENPPQPKDVERKFRTLASHILPDDSVERLVPLIRSLDDQASLEGLYSILTKHR
jgi:2-methylcitrate dehydratase PrpD